MSSQTDSIRPRFLYSIDFPNGKRYVGVSFKPKARWAEHRRQARTGSKHPLYRALRKYSGAAQFKILAIGEDAYIRDLEICLIEKWQTDRHASGYNISKGGDLGSTGLKASKATRQKMSASHKGIKQSPEWVRLRTGTQVGAKRSQESRARMSVGQKRRVRTSAELERMKELAVKAAATRSSPAYREKCRQSALKSWAKRKGK